MTRGATQRERCRREFIHGAYRHSNPKKPVPCHRDNLSEREARSPSGNIPTLAARLCRGSLFRGGAEAISFPTLYYSTYVRQNCTSPANFNIGSSGISSIQPILPSFQPKPGIAKNAGRGRLALDKPPWARAHAPTLPPPSGHSLQGGPAPLARQSVRETCEDLSLPPASA